MQIKIIQKIIDKIKRKRQKNNYIEDLGYKYLSYLVIKDKIDTIILGSSHAQLGYRAKYNEFNWGLSFQDLYSGYELYKKIHNPFIKNVILFYSVFSPGNQTIMSKYANICSVYKIIIGINYQDKKVAREKNLYKLESDYKHQYKKYKKFFKIDENYRGNEVSYITCFKPPTAAERSAAHYKNNIRQNHQTDFVLKTYELANSAKAKFLVVIPPVTKAYKESLPNSSKLFYELFELKKKNIEILNMYDSDIFNDSDFEDWDHLNFYGAQKLTKQINERLKISGGGRT